MPLDKNQYNPSDNGPVFYEVIQVIIDNTPTGAMILKSLHSKKDVVIDFEFTHSNKLAEDVLSMSGLKGKRLLKDFPVIKDTGLFNRLQEVAESGKTLDDIFTIRQNGINIEIMIHAVKFYDGCYVTVSTAHDDKNFMNEYQQKIADAKKSFLLKLSDTLHFLDNPNEIISRAIHMLGEHLNANRAGYVEDNGDGKTVTVICNYVNGVSDSVGTYHYDEYGTEILKQLREGKTIVIEDASNPPLPAGNINQLQVKGMTYKPLIKNGKLSAILFVHFKDKHIWTNEELDLIEETGERIWTAVEWARAENALIKSETDYLRKLEKEIQKSTAELRENKQFTQLITDSTPDILFVYDIKKWKIIFVNKGITASLGFEPDELYNYERKDFENLLHPDDLKRRINEMANMISLKPGEVRETKFRIKDVNGASHWWNVRDTFLKADKHGKTIQALSICRDITARIEAIEAYNKEKNRNEELKRINEIMDSFVFAAAHDLKAPVSNLQILTQVIENIDDPRQKLFLQKKYPEIIETLDHTISGLVEVLAIEKETDNVIKKLYFKKVFTEIMAELKDEISISNPNITTDFSLCKSINYIESHLFSIFRNILSNSLKYRSDARKLSITIRSGFQEDYIWLSFSDNGTGIDLEKYGEDLYKPFKRFSSRTTGSGLGLNLVKNIVTKNGGNIDVQSTKSEGTTFTVYMVSYEK